MSQIDPRTREWYLLINMENLHPQAVRSYRGLHVLEAAEHAVNGQLKVLEWICYTNGTADMQAEILWDRQIPAFMTDSEGERENFLRLMLQ